MSDYRANSDQIKAFLPHRYPFVMIDRLVEIQFTGQVGRLDPESHQGTRCVCIKSVSVNEPFFQGHFPERAVMPGVLILESLAQTACMTLYPHFVRDAAFKDRGLQCVLLGVDAARFRKPVVPGDTLVLKTNLSRARGSLWVFEAEALVEGQRVAEATLMANMTAGGA